jgi:hypothetical protein
MSKRSRVRSATEEDLVRDFGPLRARLATDEDVERVFGSANVLIGFPVRPQPEPEEQPIEGVEEQPRDQQASRVAPMVSETVSN